MPLAGCSRLVWCLRAGTQLMNVHSRFFSLMVLVSLLCGLGSAQAFDILFVPLADTMPKGKAELQPAYISRPLGAPTGGVVLNNLYYGVTDRLEISAHSAVFMGVPGNPPPMFQVNAEYRLVDSKKPNHPIVSVGAYNLNGGNFLNYNGIQPYIVVSHNVNIPDKGKPEWDDPLVRVSAGVGTVGHGLFGNVLCVFHKHLAAEAGWHGGRYNACVNWMVGDKSQYHITPAIWNGSPAIKVAYQHQF